MLAETPEFQLDMLTFGNFPMPDKAFSQHDGIVRQRAGAGDPNGYLCFKHLQSPSGPGKNPNYAGDL
jgi:hypothetical protein